MTAENAKSFFLGIPTGAYVRVKTNTGYGHSLAVVKTTSSSITVYHANYWELNCIVSYDSFTWAEFAERFPYIDYYTL